MVLGNLFYSAKQFNDKFEVKSECNKIKRLHAAADNFLIESSLNRAQSQMLTDSSSHPNKYQTFFWAKHLGKVIIAQHLSDFLKPSGSKLRGAHGCQLKCQHWACAKQIIIDPSLYLLLFISIIQHVLFQFALLLCRSVLLYTEKKNIPILLKHVSVL